MFRPVRAGSRDDAVRGSRRPHRRDLQRLRLRHDLSRRPGRRGHPGRRGKPLALRLAIRLRDLEAAEEARLDGNEHLSSPPMVRAFAVRRVGSSHAEPQEVHRHPLRRERTKPPHVSAGPVGLVGAEELDRPPGRTHLQRRHRIPDGQMPGHRHGLGPDGHRSGQRRTAFPPCRDSAHIIRRYEDLRHSGKVPESIKARLRVPGDEFTADRQPSGGLAVSAGPVRQTQGGKRRTVEQPVEDGQQVRGPTATLADRGPHGGRSLRRSGQSDVGRLRRTGRLCPTRRPPRESRPI